MSGRPYLTSHFRQLHPGDKIAVQIGDELITQTVTEMHYESGHYVPPPPLTKTQRIRRALTPRRWRRPLPTGTFTLPTMRIEAE